jgi:small nuclear ribonucleoprotein (snRNP)-like protein
LKTLVDSRARVVVTVRRVRDIRGTLTGFLVAFDRHWNLVLRDVDELWTRTEGPGRIADTVVVMRRHIRHMLCKGDTVCFICEFDPRRQTRSFLC